MRKSLEIDLAWGGFYASIPAEGGDMTVFRLLDFNRDAYHAAMFAEKFSVLPTLEQLTSLTPFIGHAPIDARGLIRDDDLRLIGSKPLTRADLEGYMYYLEAHEVPQAEMDELAERLISFSSEHPLRLQLEIVDDELLISERE
jgi:hypothetical protein